MQTAFNLLNRLPPTETYHYIDILAKKKEQLADLKSQFDTRFETRMDAKEQQPFLCCPYN